MVPIIIVFNMAQFNFLLFKEGLVLLSSSLLLCFYNTLCALLKVNSSNFYTLFAMV